MRLGLERTQVTRRRGRRCCLRQDGHRRGQDIRCPFGIGHDGSCLGGDRRLAICRFVAEEILRQDRKSERVVLLV